MQDAFLNHWRDGVEILILALGIYQIYRAFRATRGARILVGMLVILVVITLLSVVFNFPVIRWILTRGVAVMVLAAIVIFQPELRNALARLGSSRWFSFTNARRLVFIETFAEAVIKLSKNRIGALFAIERGISLKPHIETGVDLDARFSTELAMTVFHPKTPLHDGGMVIAQDRVAAAACVFPVSPREFKDRSIGLRHRAGVGLTEETDAVAVIVSEETGSIAIAVDGDLQRNLGEQEFREALAKIFLPQDANHETRSSEQLDSQDHLSDSRDRDLVSD